MRNEIVTYVPAPHWSWQYIHAIAYGILIGALI
jgi:hypothetical protein